MSILATIKEIMNIKNDPRYYTFRKAEHEMVLLKRLEDNKIFYNNTLYDKDFFYYHKLEGYMEEIYDLRDDYIRTSLHELLAPSPKPREPLKIVIKRKIRRGIRSFVNFLKFWEWNWYWKSNREKEIVATPLLMRFVDYDPNNCDEIPGLVKEQYDILVKGYKYEFSYNLNYDLFKPNIRVDLCLRPIMKDFFYDWFYTLGWKSIKPVYPTFTHLDIWRHYDDHTPTRRSDEEVARRNDWHYAYDDEANESRLQNVPSKIDKESLVFRNRYTSPTHGGSRFNIDWIEDKYDEQQKFNEFDINCKTNSYYTRYIPYNEIYNKDYPEDKKFKTDLIHDFTEEEIRENYENMIDKDKRALDKFNFVMFDERRKKAVFKFFEELEIYEISQEKLEYQGSVWDSYAVYDSDSYMWLIKERDTFICEMFNNPRHLLLMPLIDAYFEVYRSKGYYHEDESFSGPPAWTETGTHNKFMKHLMYFDLSYERQYMFAEKLWLIDDYVDIDLEDYDDFLDQEYSILISSIAVLIWLVIFTIYVSISYAWDLELFMNALHYNSDFTKNIEAFFYEDKDLRQLFAPEIYYGIELKRPRSRLRTTRVLLPFKFYETSYYSYSKKRASDMLPFTFLEQLCFELDEKDYGLYTIHHGLKRHGRSHLIWKLRFPFIEEPWHWTAADPSPWMRFKAFVKLKIDNYYKYYYDPFFYDTFVPWALHIKDTYYTPMMKDIRPHWRVFRRKYILPVRKFIKYYKSQVIDFFKTPKN